MKSKSTYFLSFLGKIKMPIINTKKAGIILELFIPPLKIQITEIEKREIIMRGILNGSNICLNLTK